MPFVKGQPFKPKFDHPGGTIEFYIAGTSTPTPYYVDGAGTAGGVTAAIGLDGEPETEIFYDSDVVYRMLVKDAEGDTVETVTSYTPVGASQDNSISLPSTAVDIRTANLAGVTSVETLGFYLVGDGGHARYRADTTDTTSADDGVLVLVSQDGVRFKLIPDRPTLKQLGVIGSEDDTVRLQAALNCGLSEIYGDAGAVFTHQGVTLPSDLTFLAGDAEIRYNAPGSVKDEAGFRADQEQNVRIVGGKWTFSGSGDQNPILVHFCGCVDSGITGHEMDGGGVCHRGVVADSVSGDRTDNLRITIEGAKRVTGFSSYGTELVRTTDSNYARNAADNCLDGLKTRQRCLNTRVESNIHHSNARDGFDFFSGFRGGIIANNISHSNALQGFECKGLPSVEVIVGSSVSGRFTSGEALSFSPSGATATLADVGGGVLTVQSLTGTPANGDTILGATSGATATQSGDPSPLDYSFRDNVFSDNKSERNVVRGATFQGGRNIQGQGNSFTDNDGDGVLLNDVQMSDIGGSVSGSELHGVLCQSVSRCTLSFHARDNNTSNTDDKNGIHCDANTDGNTFVAPMVLNGTIASRSGHQKYGIFFEDGSVSNTVIGGRLFDNEVGDVGGDIYANNIVTFDSLNRPYFANGLLATTAELNDITSPVNTKNKYLGKQIFNSTNNRVFYAHGSDPGSIWADDVGTTAHTPV